METFLNNFPKVRGRITFLWIKSGESFKERFETIKEAFPANVTFIEVEDVRDLPKIAVGKAFGEYAESH